MEFTTQLELQSQTTRLVEHLSYTSFLLFKRGCHPPRHPFPEDLTINEVDNSSTDYNSEDFQSELFPLHSQLLGKSLLVSFPPLSDMLKFSGFSCLIGDLRCFSRHQKICNMIWKSRHEVISSCTSKIVIIFIIVSTITDHDEIRISLCSDNTNTPTNMLNRAQVAFEDLMTH